jgi:hypothetical protein
VAQHSGGQVDAEGGPAQFADLGGVDAGAAPDFQADAVALAEEVTEEAVETEGAAV